MSAAPSAPSPDSAAAVLPFLFLNHRLEPARLRACVREIREAGGDGFFIHAREGLATPYLSDEWFAAVECCIATARELGLRAWLYDEMPYPSGVAGGEVVRRRPDFVEQSLAVQRRTLPGGRRMEWRLGAGEIIACHARRGDAVIDLRAAIGPVADTWKKTDVMDSRLYYPGGPIEIFTCPRSICVRPENRLAVTLPPGKWEVVAVAVKRGGELLEPFGAYVDVSNAEATALFLELTHEAYRRRFGRHFGQTIPGIFTDEPKFRHPLPWGRGVAAKVGKISPALTFALAGEPGAAAAAERHRYRALTARAFTENWTKPISRWCARHGLKFTGHISPEEEWWFESRHVGSVLKNLRQFHAPGCDLIVPAAGDRKNALLTLMPGLAVSAAAQAGRPQVVCELFGACDFTLGLRTMKRLADWLACAGVNVLVPHGFFYSLDGYRKLDAPPSFAPPAFAAEDLKAWADEFRAQAAQLGPTVAPDVLIVRPMDFLRGLPDAAEARVMKLVDRAARLAGALARRGLRVHWIDDDELARVRGRDGRVGFGRCRYAHLVYFGDFTAAETRKQFDAWAKKVSVVEAGAAWRQITGPLASNGDVHAARRRDGRWFCANIGRTAATFRLGQASGTLQPGESRVVDAAGARPVPAKRSVWQRLPDRWRVTWPQTNTIYLHDWTLNGRKTALGPAFEVQPERVREWGQTIFGPVPLQAKIDAAQIWLYRTEFELKENVALRLVCEEGYLRGAWSAVLNGRPLRNWHSGGDFLRTHALAGKTRRGRNRLEFHFTLREVTDGMLGPCRLEGPGLVLPGGAIARLPGQGGVATAATTRATLGLPYYGGAVVYAQEFEWRGPAGAPVSLEFSAPPGNGAAVKLNGVDCGAVRWAPDCVEVTAALRRGRNRLEIYLNGSPVVLCGRVDTTKLGARVRLMQR